MSFHIDDDFLYEVMPKIEASLLQDIPSERELTHKFSKRFNHKMKAMLRYERRTPAMRTFFKYARTAVAVLLICLTLSFGTVMSVKAYRVRFFEIVTQVWDEFTSIITRSEENTGNDTLILSSPTYIPEGYTIIEQSHTEYKNSIIYADEDGNEVYYLQNLATQNELIFDSEDAEIEEITINSHKAILVLNKGTTQLHWSDNFSTYTIIGAIDKNALISMAKSIEKNK